MVKRWFTIVVTLLVVSFLVVGCGIPQEEHDAVIADLAAAESNLAAVQSELAAVASQVSTLEVDLAAAEAEVSTLEVNLAAAEAEVSVLEEGPAPHTLGLPS